MATTSAVRSAFVLTLGLAAGCALKGDVRKVELQVQALQADLAKSDAARAAERDTILAAVRLLQQALATQQAYLVQLRGDLRTELLAVQQQLVAVQELTGQSQQRLTELRSRMEARAQQPDPVVPGQTGGGGGGRARRCLRQPRGSRPRPDVRHLAAAIPPRQSRDRAARLPGIPARLSLA